MRRSFSREHSFFTSYYVYYDVDTAPAPGCVFSGSGWLKALTPFKWNETFKIWRWAPEYLINQINKNIYNCSWYCSCLIDFANSNYFGKNEHAYFIHIHYHIYINIIDIGVVDSVYIMLNQAGTTPMQFVMIYGVKRTICYRANTCQFARARLVSIQKFTRRIYHNPGKPPVLMSLPCTAKLLQVQLYSTGN